MPLTELLDHVSPFTCTKASSGPLLAFSSTLASVPDRASKCRIVRGLFVGDVSADPNLWGFCGGRDCAGSRGPGRRRSGVTIAWCRSHARRVPADRGRPVSPCDPVCPGGAITGSDRRMVTSSAKGAPNADYVLTVSVYVDYDFRA